MVCAARRQTSSRFPVASADSAVGRDEFGTRKPVPLTSRFTGGGDSSHRAYGLDSRHDLRRSGRYELSRDTHSAGHGTVAPIGGNGLLVANAEYRFPVFASVAVRSSST